ncbi:hypothetical protein KB20921_32940 [Edwardsiella ictaluri]|nr:hypothetical protein KH20906_32850 [Edwardsiella ictaluri]BEI04033.1 hypothetical protein KB20921_32940 [Edwardsiella ictaluri]BEI07488.1 hypothetical protein KH201010_32740 [Edwardsiella ictaluri]BEI10960.1 hypothetical protein STU22726_32910 [Edwardsiella ictaluri]BEI14440.1 hypothetical protein STU22816_32930 [Edwardsiella ictaluri]
MSQAVSSSLGQGAQGPVKPAIFTRRDKNGGASLNTVSLLDLFIGHLAFFDLLNNGYLKG